jgi:hypothetical protein
MASNLDWKVGLADAHDAPCEACGRPMTHLGNMPRTSRRDAIRVFRCYGCNAVVAEQWSSLNETTDRHCPV